MNQHIREIIDHLVSYTYGNPSPKTVLSLLTDFGFTRKDIQFTVQIGLDEGLWHLDKDMHLAKGPLFPQRSN